MKIEAIGNIKYKGTYRSPGTPFECDEETAKRLIDLGQATDIIDPAMIEIAEEKLKVAQEEKAALEKKLKAALSQNAKIQSDLDKLKSKLEKIKDPEKKEIVKEKIEKLQTKKVDSKNLADQLDAKDKEIKNYSVK